MEGLITTGFNVMVKDSFPTSSEKGFSAVTVEVCFFFFKKGTFAAVTCQAVAAAFKTW